MDISRIHLNSWKKSHIHSHSRWERPLRLVIQFVLKLLKGGALLYFTVYLPIWGQRSDNINAHSQKITIIKHNQQIPSLSNTPTFVFFCFLFFVFLMFFFLEIHVLLFIYLFIYDCVGSSFLCERFL